MSFEIRALVAPKPVLEPVAASLPGATLAELAHGLWLVPLKQSVRIPPVAKPSPFDRIQIPAFLADAATRASAAGPIAYIEADYKPGKDYQASVLWSRGKLAYAPRVDTAAWDPREAAMKERPVNTVLRAMGVQAMGYGDEWDAVALARHSRTEDW